jgi:hypothetical protein
MIADAEAAFSAQVRQEQLARAAKLRWIHSPAAARDPSSSPIPAEWRPRRWRSMPWR